MIIIDTQHWSSEVAPLLKKSYRSVLKLSQHALTLRALLWLFVVAIVATFSNQMSATAVTESRGTKPVNPVKALNFFTTVGKSVQIVSEIMSSGIDPSKMIKL